ncbi:MAG: ribonuclease HII [Candidatus Krumholzibacteriota bacterium]|nr:ribonuclease HII [Candidatus Krumholzibacteriota bacterium]
MRVKSPNSFQELVDFDREKRESRAGPLAGVDEAGRGALAGPVVAAAVICEPGPGLERVTDSKLLSEPVREELFEVIRENSSAYAIGIVESDEIDRINILQATLKAMSEAVEGLSITPSLVLIDGPRRPRLDCPCEAVTGGDRKSFAIAAASIVAKVTRDRIMREKNGHFPGYGFHRNKGYGTREHRQTIARKGRSAYHRLSFKLQLEKRGGGSEGAEGTGFARREDRR